MANGKLSIKQLRKIMDSARVDAERDLSSSQDYEQFQYAAGAARGAGMVIHSVILAAFGLPHECGDVFNQYTDYSGYINARVGFHLGRFTGAER